MSHPPLTEPVLSASGRQVLALVTNRFVAEDADQAVDLYRYSLDTGTWQRVPRAALIGEADPFSRWHLRLLSASHDGRYVAYVASRPVSWDGSSLPPLLARFDIETGARQVIRDAIDDPFAQPVMSRDGNTFAWVGANNAVLVGRVGHVPVAIGQACPTNASTCAAGVALPADGGRVYYAATDGADAVLASFDLATRASRRFVTFRFPVDTTLVATGSGRHVLAAATSLFPGGSTILDTETEEVIASDIPASQFRPMLTDDATYVKGGLDGFGQPAAVYDVRLGAGLSLQSPLAPPTLLLACCLSGLSADGRIGAGFGQNGDFVLISLDADADGMFDPWELTMGLDTTNPDDALTDPDSDGVTNADEFRLRSHPLGAFRRIFAEGVTSGYFDTALHLFRPRLSNQGLAAPPIIKFLGDNGRRVSRVYQPRLFVDPEPLDVRAPAELGTGQYSVIVESAWPVAVERITRWGNPLAIGAHGTSGAPGPSTTWYFAEGATTGGFQLFYLLANPGESAVTVDVDYLKASGGVVTRRHDVPPGGRATIWVNQEGDGLDGAEVAARITSSQPIVAERTMYLPGPGGFTAGTASMGAWAAATRWLFAEGVTGPLFDAFVLLANPASTPAQVEITFRLPDGQPVTRQVTVPGESRRTIWVDQESPLLADTAFSTTVTSDVPVVAERAMWWRTPSSAAWVEGHSEFGATAGATRWAVAEMPESAFLLIANATDTPAVVRVTYYQENGGGAGQAEYTLAPDGRVTAWPTQDNPQLPPARYRAFIESLPIGGGQPAEIIVERAAYAPDFSAGTAYLATPIP